MKYLKIVLFPSPLISDGDRIPSGHSIQRVRAVPHFLQIPGIIYVCFDYFPAIAQVWINLHRQNVFYTVMLWKGSQVPQELGGRRRSHDEKGNQGVGRFRFTNILEIFSIYFFFSITLLYHFFLYFFDTPYLPTPTTHDPRPTTHDPRPTTPTTTYDI